MFFVKLKIESCNLYDDAIIVYFLNHNTNSYITIKQLHFIWNKNKQKYIANTFIHFSQTTEKNLIVKYSNGINIMYKNVLITNNNYKNKFVIDLDSINDNLCDDSLKNIIENKLHSK